MRTPKNITKEAQYTSGGDFIDSSQKLYVGYYVEVNGKFYKGKTYDGKNKTLSKINKQEGATSPFLKNNLLGKLIKSASSVVKSKIFQRTPEDIARGYSIRYFSKQKNVNPILIKEIDLDTYQKQQRNVLYQIISLKYYVMEKEGQTQNQGYFNDLDLDNADKEMPGIKLYLLSEKNNF